MEPSLHRHLRWGAEALWQRLVPLLPGLSVEVLARTDSTNTRLLERARGGDGRRDARISGFGSLDDAAGEQRGRRAADVQPCLLVAEHQTGGRGRQGRPWQSAPGASLTFSLGLPLAPVDWSGLSLAVGVALADALDPQGIEGAPRIGLKWPNDLWLLDAPGHGRKLGGVLIETVAVGARRLAVIGVGLNVLPVAGNGDGFSTGFACLGELDREATAPDILARVAEPLTHAVLLFEREGFAPFAGRFAHRDLLRGRPVTTTLAELPEGVAEGVDSRGVLQVRAGGVLHRVSSGEVSVRPVPGAAEGNPC